MQGTGTQTDPYIPGNWEEFVEAVGTENKYVRLPEGGGQFNMNEIDPVGGFTVNVRCSQIDGNGWIVHAPHNIRFYSSYQPTVINDLHFAEILHTNDNAVFRIYGGEFNRCTFAGKLAGGDSCYLLDEISRLSQCSFTIGFSGKAHQLFYGEAYNGLTANIIKATLDYTGCTYTSTEMIDTDSDKKIYDSFFEFVNCNLNLNYRGARSVFHFNDNGGYVRNADGVKKNVTEKQISDAAYLESVGYPIHTGGLS